MKIQIQSDGVTVWVNDNTGYCIGRFGRMGIDIHAGPDSDTECLYCTHQPVTKTDWQTFVDGMKKFHNVTGLEKHCPLRFKEMS